MTQSRLRITLYTGWVISLLLSVLLLLLGPALRRDESLGYNQVFAVIPAVIGLHVPALTTFAAYWFPQEERARAKAISMNQERAIGGISLTVLYLLIVFCVIAWPTLIISYKTAGLELPQEESFIARINDAVKIALMLSPVALAPSAYLTRLESPAAAPEKEKAAKAKAKADADAEGEEAPKAKAKGKAKGKTAGDPTTPDAG